MSMDNSHLSQNHESQIVNSPVVNSTGSLISDAELGVLDLGVLDLLTKPAYVVREVQEREKHLKQYWEKHGCTLILDSWTSRCGRHFIGILVHCYAGMLFLKSMEISAIIDGVDELASMICEVVDEIGAKNIVQIINSDASPHMYAAEQVVLKKYDHSFSFALCADYCINMLLEDIAKLDHVSGVLMKAKQITTFVYSHALPMELKESFIPGGEIISNSNLRYVAMFVTLEKLVSQRAKLVEMFSSPRWTSSDMASTNLSERICEIIGSDNTFWSAAAEILKVTGPIVNVLLKLQTDSPMGVLYDAMDTAKVEIKQNVGDDYGIYWKMVDKIWDDYLHSSIHAAAYVLNPKVSFSNRFRYDDEISDGIRSCIIQVAKTKANAFLASKQFNLYKQNLGLFDSGIAAREATEIHQGSWWLKYGADKEELQYIAKRILSQTCFGASRYNLDHSLSERLHTEVRSYPDQERFRKLEYIHYNLRLRDSKPRLLGPAEGTSTARRVLGDWISEAHAGA